ncbi:hypothetical protein BH23GEM11_BH23GEM11_21520 [soil metagenome]
MGESSRTATTELPEPDASPTDSANTSPSPRLRGTGVIPDQGSTPPAAPAPPPPLTLGERVLAWRDRILAAPSFQRWAAAFPLTRPIALSRSRRVFDLCAGFVYSQTVLAAVRLDLFSRLSNGPMEVGTLAEACDLPPERLERLLGSATAPGLLRRTRSGRIALGPLGAPMVGNEALARMVEHNVLFYRDLADPVNLLRDGPGEDGLLHGYLAYTRTGDSKDLTSEQVGPYSALMAASQPLVSREILDAYPFQRHRRILDVGGGEGAFLDAVGMRHPRLELGLFDLPAVAARARERLEERFAPAGCTWREGTSSGTPSRRVPT